jgi:signal transduction histidine kinase
VTDLAASCPNGKVELSVSDTGVGIPPDGDRMFEPFYRVKGSQPLRGRA